MATPTTLPATFVAGNVLTAAQMNDLRGAFRVLQVVSTTKTDTFSTSSTTLVDITGMSVTITPSSTSSLILITAALNIGSSGQGPITATVLLRGSTAIYRGDAAGNRTRAASGSRVSSDAALDSVTYNFLDNPTTTSATTYKIQMQTSSSTSFLNRTSFDSDLTGFVRTASTITAMEISA